MMMRLALLLLLASVALVSAQVTQVKLPYQLAAIDPTIDAKTMDFHFNTHYKAYVDNLNKATATAAPSVKASDLSSLVKQVATLRESKDLFAAVRNQGGGAWNHALYFKHLAPAGSANAATTAISADLSKAITSSFGGVAKMQEELTTAATKQFGSGWAWLCYTGQKLVVTSTPNQDNPLMGNLPGAPEVKHAGCTPILGIDVWEHAYYLKHGPKRAAYLADFWKVVDWAQVSKNFAAAKAGQVQALVA